MTPRLRHLLEGVRIFPRKKIEEETSLDRCWGLPRSRYSVLEGLTEINQSIKFNVRFIVRRRFGDAASGHSKIHTHHPCDEITDPLREISVPVPKSNKSVLKEREKLWRKKMSLKLRQKR